MAKNWTPEERAVYRGQLLAKMTHHVGRANKIGMGELYESVFNRQAHNRINDSRPIRKLIDELRKEGVPIMSEVSNQEPGYFLAAGGSDLINYCRRLHDRAMGLLAQEARMKKMALPELVGQMKIEMEAKHD